MSIKAHLFYAASGDNVIDLEDVGNGTKTFKPADTALVLMVRGIRTKWSQPFFNEISKNMYVDT